QKRLVISGTYLADSHHPHRHPDILWEGVEAVAERLFQSGPTYGQSVRSTSPLTDNDARVSHALEARLEHHLHNGQSVDWLSRVQQLVLIEIGLGSLG
ncbi:hypothetical protein, partial [Brucella anthropi]|uniref:hypothetical protein n=1 Tax=Brucella anthropi TaxID=529 RepID=UPI0024468F54